MSSPKHERTSPDGVGAVPYLPLSSDEEAAASEQSIGRLVGDATQHLSTLVRAEVELAKSELVAEMKKALKGAVFFLIALAVGLYSSYFLFLFVAEILSDWWGVRWPAFLTVFRPDAADHGADRVPRLAQGEEATRPGTHYRQCQGDRRGTQAA